MAIKAGQILHAMNTFVVDRIQTGGPGNLNIPQERIRELGNYESVAIVRDVPDLTFNLECLDVDTEVEGLLTGSDNPIGDADGTEYDLSVNYPVDIVSPLKSAVGSFDIVKGIATPHLNLEQAAYRFGLRDNAGSTFTLRGDAIYYIPGTPYVALYDGNGSTTSYSFIDSRNATPSSLTAIPYSERDDTIYALNVSVDGVRKTRDTDYTQTSSGITFVTAPANGAEIRIVFGSTTAATYDQTVHEGIAVKPAAIRGKDIDVYVGEDGATPAGPLRWSDVQSVTVDWRVTIEEDFEFGNYRAVARDATDVPDVTGTIELKPVSMASWFTKIQQMTGIGASYIVGPDSSVELPLRIELRNPASGGTTAVAAGAIVKTFYIPDARFTIPGYEGRVGQKYVTTVNWQSDSGALKIYKGAKP